MNLLGWERTVAWNQRRQQDSPSPLKIRSYISAYFQEQRGMGRRKKVLGWKDIREEGKIGYIRQKMG